MADRPQRAARGTETSTGQTAYKPQGTNILTEPWPGTDPEQRKPSCDKRMQQFDPLKYNPGWAKSEEEEEGGWEVGTKCPVHLRRCANTPRSEQRNGAPRSDAASTRPGRPLPGAWGAAGHGGTERPAVYSYVTPRFADMNTGLNLWAPFWVRIKYREPWPPRSIISPVRVAQV